MRKQYRSITNVGDPDVWWFSFVISVDIANVLNHWRMNTYFFRGFFSSLMEAYSSQTLYYANKVPLFVPNFLLYFIMSIAGIWKCQDIALINKSHINKHINSNNKNLNILNLTFISSRRVIATTVHSTNNEE